MHDAHLALTLTAFITTFAIGAGLLALWIVAVVSILRSVLIEPVVKALWILAAFTFPIVGPIVWLVVSRYQRRRAEEFGGGTGAAPLAV